MSEKNLQDRISGIEKSKSLWWVIAISFLSIVAGAALVNVAGQMLFLLHGDSAITMWAPLLITFFGLGFLTAVTYWAIRFLRDHQRLQQERWQELLARHEREELKRENSQKPETLVKENNLKQEKALEQLKSWYTFLEKMEPDRENQTDAYEIYREVLTNIQSKILEQSSAWLTTAEKIIEPDTKEEPWVTENKNQPQKENLEL